MENGQLITMNFEIFKADSFRAFVMQIVKETKTDKSILMVLANARFYHAVINWELTASLKNKIKLMYFLSYSPKLNPIDSLWKKTRCSETRNRYFESLTEQWGCLERFFKIIIDDFIHTFFNENQRVRYSS